MDVNTKNLTVLTASTLGISVVNFPSQCEVRRIAAIRVRALCYGIPKRPSFVVRIPCRRKDSTTVGKMPFLACGPRSVTQELDGEWWRAQGFGPCASRARGWWTQAQSACARCDLVRINFNTYTYYIIFSRSDRFVFFFPRRGTEGNLGGELGSGPLLLALCRRTPSSKYK
jgi:hypothetical protein